MEHFILNCVGPLLLCDQSAHTSVMIQNLAHLSDPLALKSTRT